eukprot:gene19263-25899_t
MQLPVKPSPPGEGGCYAATLIEEEAISTLFSSRAAVSAADRRKSAGPVHADTVSTVSSPLPSRFADVSCSDNEAEHCFGLLHLTSLSNIGSAKPQAAVELESLPCSTRVGESLNSTPVDFDIPCDFANKCPSHALRPTDVGDQDLYSDPSSVVECKAAHAVSMPPPPQALSCFAPQQAFPDKNPPARFEPEAHTAKSTLGLAACTPPLHKASPWFISSNIDSSGDRHDAEVEALKQFGFYYSQPFSHCPIWKSDSNNALHDMSFYGYVFNGDS